MGKTVKPKTCGALNTSSPEFGEAGCKRLPRHLGDHRVTLHRPAIVRKPRVTADGTAKTVRKLSAVKRRQLAVKLASQLEAGTITASQAMSKFAAATK